MTELSSWNRCHVTHKLFKQKFAKPSRIFAWLSPYLGFGANVTPSERHVPSHSQSLFHIILLISSQDSFEIILLVWLLIAY